jgi:hypothetical protein
MFRNSTPKLAFLGAALAASSACFGQVSSYQVWNNAPLYPCMVSPVAPTSSSNPTYTVYFATTSPLTQDVYVDLQTSPDGAIWSTVTEKYILASRTTAAGTTYQMTVNVKTVHARLRIGCTGTVASLGTASAWIVN